MAKLSIFIDEAGDPGVRDGLRYYGLRHEWLATSALVIRTQNEPLVVDWVRKLRETARARQAGVLHYHKITKERRLGVCAELASFSCRAFVMVSHKSNLREYINPRICAQMDDGTFYNWCLRLLLERVTDWALDWMKRNGNRQPEPLAITFARRGGHDYAHFLSYMETLRFQEAHGQLFLRGPGLAEPTLDQADWRIAETHEHAGLQIADVIASAFYQASNTASPTHDIEPARALRPIIVAKRGVAANRGVTVWPLPHQSPLSEAAKPIFREYGFAW